MEEWISGRMEVRKGGRVVVDNFGIRMSVVVDNFCVWNGKAVEWRSGRVEGWKYGRVGEWLLTTLAFECQWCAARVAYAVRRHVRHVWHMSNCVDLRDC